MHLPVLSPAQSAEWDRRAVEAGHSLAAGGVHPGRERVPRLHGAVSMHLPVLSPAQSAEWDRRAVEAGHSLATLMDAAGRAAAQVIARRYGNRLRGGVL